MSVLPDEQVIPHELGIQWAIGAPLPCIVQSELHTFLAFYSRASAHPLPSKDVELLTHDTAANIAVIEWLGCAGTIMNGPSDEMINRHRLWTKGLRDVPRYRSSVVRNSRWVAELEGISAIHPAGIMKADTNLVHHVLEFHDSVFECVATGFRIESAHDTLRNILTSLVARLST